MKIAPEILDAILERAADNSIEKFVKWLRGQVAAADRLPNGDLQATTTTITPEMAAFLLKYRNPRNRVLTEGNIKTIQAQMESNGWMLTSQGISISKDGNLNDGQHRLWACALSGVPFKTLMVFGEEREAQNVLDTGRKRRPSDALSLLEMEIKNEVVVAAAARLLFYYENGLMGSHPAVTNSAISEVVNSNKGIVDSAGHAKKFAGKVKAAPGAATFAIFLIERALKKATPGTKDKYNIFLDRLAKGGGDNDHCLHLRDGLMRGTFTREIKGSLDRSYAQAAAIIRGWNSYLADAHINRKKKTISERLAITPWKPGNKFPTPEYR